MNWVNVSTEQEKLLHTARIVVSEIVKTNGSIREVYFHDAKTHVSYKLIPAPCGGIIELLTPEVTNVYVVRGKSGGLFSNFIKTFKTSGEASSYLHKMLGDAGITGGWEQLFEINVEGTTDPSAFFVDNLATGSEEFQG